MIKLLCIYFGVTVVVRDYTKMKKENCRLFTEYGGKRYQRPCGIAIGPNEEVVIVDEINQDAVIFDKSLTQMRMFGQGSGVVLGRMYIFNIRRFYY